MNCDPSTNPATAHRLSIKIVGVGNAGISALADLALKAPPDVKFAALNTEASISDLPPIVEYVQLETRLLRGLGTGGDPDRGRNVAEASEDKLKAICDGADVLFIIAGLGGGAGTGICPVLAKVARQKGALVLGFIATPFDCEGKRRQSLAQDGLEALRAAADGVICMPNQMMLRLIDENTSVLDTFKKANELIVEAVIGIWRLIAHKGLIEIRFEELTGLLRGQHVESVCATAIACGSSRVADALERLLVHPMLNSGQKLQQSDIILVSLTAGPNLTMSEVNNVMGSVQRRCPDAQIIMGAAVDPAFGENLAITMIAARKEEEDSETESPSRHADITTHLIDRTSTPKPPSRFVPPPAGPGNDRFGKTIVTPGKTAGRSRNSRGPKMLQGHLPLDIVSRGRFDKSEPTIHHGEDLDVPTYIRRGILLN
jgi:cell division protein FtsZ